MRLKSLVTPVVALALLLSASVVRADTLDKELTALKDKLAKQLIVKGRKKAAALDFTDLQGRKNELGRYLTERLTVEMGDAEGISVVDRANLKSILDEHKLTEEGLVKPENAKKLGEFSGVDAIIIGTVSVAGSDVELLAKAISTDTAEIVATGRMRFAKTPEMQELLAKAIAPNAPIGGGQPPAGGAANAGAIEALPAIFTKDVGPLRLALTNVIQKKNGAVVCALQLTNLDLQKTLRLAQNCRYGSQIWERRAKITDFGGSEFELKEITGLPTVISIDPANIARIVSTGKQVDEDADVFHNPAAWCGGFATIEPSQSIRVSLEFRAGNRSELKEPFQFQTELVIGVCESPDKQCRWKLEALVVDKVMPPKSRP